MPHPAPPLLSESRKFVPGSPLYLTLSGNEITDAVRAAALQGDGLAPEGSMGVWEPTTNYLLNGGAESNTTSISANGSASLSRDTARSKFGAASIKAITPGVGSEEGLNYAPQAGSASAGQVWAGSVWLYHEEASAVTFRVKLSWRNSGDGAISDSLAHTLVSPGVWTKASVAATAPALTNRVRLKPVTSSPVALTFWADGAQAERLLAKPYVETDGASASRGASRVQVPVAGVIDETQGWFAARVRMNWANTADPSGNPALFDWRDDASNLIQVRYDTTSDQWELQRRNGGGSGEAVKADTFALGDVVTVIAAWDASNLKVSVDGAAFTSAAAANIPTLAASAFDIGSVGGSSEHIDGDIFWSACGTGTLTDTDASNLHANGNPDPPPGLFPTAAAVKLIWAARDNIARTF